MQLETERLLLRPLRIDDLDALAELYGDAEVMRYIGGGGTIDRERTRQSLERMIAGFAERGYGILAVERKEDGAFMGRCGLLLWDSATWTPTRMAEATARVETEVGYLLGPDFWGKGYATEAAMAVRDWAFENLELERLIALIRPGNDRSVRVALKLGMEPDGGIELLGHPATVYALEL